MCVLLDWKIYHFFQSIYIIALVSISFAIKFTRLVRKKKREGTGLLDWIKGGFVNRITWKPKGIQGVKNTLASTSRITVTACDEESRVV